jgi:hypothetical protein
MYDFDGSTNSSTAKILTSIASEKMHNSIRPVTMASKPTRDPTFKLPHKDNNLIYLPESSALERHNYNMYKEIPHIDFLPIYTRGYYTPTETGWSNMRYEDFFRN